MIKTIFWIIVILIIIGLGLTYAPELTKSIGGWLTGKAIEGAEFAKDAAVDVLKNVTS
jgi:hypothetical protein